MSTSSDKHMPSNPNDSAEMVTTMPWDELSSQVALDTQAEFSDWLEAELDELETELARFTSPASKFSGRR